MPNILGIDPGGKTGIAMLREKGTVTFNDLEYVEIEGGYSGFVNWWEDNWKWLGFDVHGEWDIIVERFELRKQDFVADITPKEIIGMLKYWARIHDRELFWAMAGAHKGLVTDEALKRAGLYPPRGQVKGGHSTDGMRLCAYHRIKNLRDREFAARLFPKSNNN